MTDFHSRCASLLLEVLQAAVDAKALAQAHVDQAATALRSTADAEPRTVEMLLEDALSASKAELAAALAQLDKAKGAPLLKRWSLGRAARREVADALSQLEHKTKIEMQAGHARQRAIDSNLRATQHAAHEACKLTLRQASSTLTKYTQLEKVLETLCGPLRRAIDCGAWLARDTEARMTNASQFARGGRWDQVAKIFQGLRFQIPPSERKLTEWASERRKLVSRIVNQRSGFSATAAFPGLIDPSLTLAKGRCHADAWEQAVDCYLESPDRWHALPACLLTPGALIEPTQWVLYWAFLIESQGFAESASAAISHEDVLTGMLTQALKGQLENATKTRLLNLGYPQAKANLSFLQLAGLQSEFKTGADIGLVIQINVGDFSVNKVALLQAKVSIDGTADIGSKPSGPHKLTQLQKLTDAKRDFFLFYHRTEGLSPAALPTVTSVNHFVSSRKMTANDLAKLSVSVKTRLQGWDLASFIAFGLCTPANSMGKDVPVGSDPLEALMAGGRDFLPAYMIVVSFGHDETGYHKIMTPLQERGYDAMRTPRRGHRLQQAREPDEKDFEGHEMG